MSPSHYTPRVHGTPGHFIAVNGCCFRLHATVGNVRVSTVGCWHPQSKPFGDPEEIGCGRLYETLVFRVDPSSLDDYDTPSVVDWSEFDSDAYNTSQDAERGHERMVDKWSDIEYQRNALAERVSA